MESAEQIFEAAYYFLNDFTVVIFGLEIVLCFRKNHRSYFALRLIICAILLLMIPRVISHLLPTESLNVFVEKSTIMNFYYWKALYIGWFNYSWLLLFFITMGIMLFCFRLTLRELLYYSSAAYAIQNLLSNGRAAIRYGLLEDLEPTYYYFIGFAIEIAVFIFAYFALGRNADKKGTVNIDSGLLGVFAFVSILIINVLNWLVSATNSHNSFVDVYSAIAALFLLLIQIGLFERGKLKIEKEMFEQILSITQTQAANSKANIDLINRKCHDLKHQISAMRMMGNGAGQEQVIKDIEDAILFYDSYAKTGNVYLDAVLTEKSLLCDAKKIVLTYIIPGNRLDFMEPVDVYSLFGNALDNAIEAVEKEAIENRIISITSTERGNFVGIRIENYCCVSLTFADGLPQTTKDDNGYHGFGSKSIRYIVEKYGGECMMSQELDRFVLTMLFTTK